MIKYVSISWLITTIVLVVAFAFKTNATKTKNTFAIQNVYTGKNLRPFEAGKDDGNKIVLYDHHSWKCMTWEIIQVGKETYQLKNRYTLKNLQSASKSDQEVCLFQQPLKKDSLQYWELISQPDKTYFIRLKGTELYVTISSDKTNSPIVLMKKHNSSAQQWKLVKQDPCI